MQVGYEPWTLLCKTMHGSPSIHRPGSGPRSGDEKASEGNMRQYELQCGSPEEANILGCISATEDQDEFEDRMMWRLPGANGSMQAEANIR